jgi:hypothetical protein
MVINMNALHGGHNVLHHAHHHQRRAYVLARAVQVPQVDGGTAKQSNDQIIHRPGNAPQKPVR